MLFKFSFSKIYEWFSGGVKLILYAFHSQAFQLHFGGCAFRSLAQITARSLEPFFLMKKENFAVIKNVFLFLELVSFVEVPQTSEQKTENVFERETHSHIRPVCQSFRVLPHHHLD